MLSLWRKRCDCVRTKLCAANKCLYIIRNLRKEGYVQHEIDHLFDSIVLPKLTYGLSVYGASPSDLTLVQNFLTRCHKRRYTSKKYIISDLLEQSDRRLFKCLNNSSHPLYHLLPRLKESSKRLRTRSAILPLENTERFKDSFLIG